METRIFRLQCKTDEAPPEFFPSYTQTVSGNLPSERMFGWWFMSWIRFFFFGFLSSSLKRETFFYVNTVVKSIKQWRRWCHSGNTHPPDSLGKVSTPLSFYATLQFHFPQYFSFFERFNQITENNSLFKTPQQEQCVKGTLSWVSISFDIVIYGL